MSKLRSVSTAFWSDPFIEDLTPSEKLLFLYFITNDKTNMLGIYEVSIKKISYDTGLNKDVIEKALKEFERLNKVKYVSNHIILVNFMKHQNYNTNMKKSAIDCYNDLPKELKNNSLTINKDNPLEGFESLLNHYGMVRKEEVEYEVEEEIEFKVEEESEKKKKGGVLIEIHFPFESDLFLEQWNLWKDYKQKEFKFKYKSIHSEQGALIELNKLSGQNQEKAIAIIHQSISKGWQGFFELKNTTNGKQTTNTCGNYSEEFMRKIATGLQS